MIRALLLVLVGAALAIAFPASGQIIYKQELPDGTVVYADHRIKGAKLLYRVTMPDLQAPGQAAPPRSSADAAALDKRLRERANALDRAQREVVEAERALADAKHQLEVGKELMPGEIQSSATGTTRVLPQYHERVKKLQDEVGSAQLRLDRAYAARNELR